MRRCVAILLLVLLSGCATTYQSSTRPPEAFRADLTACGGATDGQVYVVPVWFLPVMAVAWVADETIRQRCMADRGWEAVDPPSQDSPTSLPE